MGTVKFTERLGTTRLVGGSSSKTDSGRFREPSELSTPSTLLVAIASSTLTAFPPRTCRCHLFLCGFSCFRGGRLDCSPLTFSSCTIRFTDNCSFLPHTVEGLVSVAATHVQPTMASFAGKPADSNKKTEFQTDFSAVAHTVCQHASPWFLTTIWKH